MKINSKHISITKLSLVSTLSYMSMTYAFFDDPFEKNFITHMHNIQKEMRNMFDNVDTMLQQHTISARNQAIQKNSQSTSVDASNNNLAHFFQESSSSLSFANQEKAILITTKKNEIGTTYTIKVTEKQKHNLSDDYDHVQDLESLHDYIEEKFKSHQAQQILEECIHALTEQSDNQTISIQSTDNNNTRIYTIEIENQQQKKKNQNIDNDLDTIETEQLEPNRNRKKKKSQNYNSRRKN